jgi:hypothetical protein
MSHEDQAVEPDKDVDGAQFNAIFWDISGHNAAGDIAWVLVSSAGAWLASGEAFNPDADAALRPTCLRLSAGIYTVTYETSYYDEDYYRDQATATKKPLSLYAGHVTAQGTTPNVVGVVDVQLVAGKWVCTVKLTIGNTGVLTDSKFCLDVR